MKGSSSAFDTHYPPASFFFSFLFFLTLVWHKQNSIPWRVNEALLLQADLQAASSHYHKSMRVISYVAAFCFCVQEIISPQRYVVVAKDVSNSSLNVWLTPTMSSMFVLKMSQAATHRVTTPDRLWRCCAEGVWADGSERLNRKWTGGDQNEWWRDAVQLEREGGGKKEIGKLRARTFSSFILIAQGHFSPFAPSTSLAIRASL